MRIILDLDRIGDAEACLRLALEQQRSDPEADFGYWSQRDPDFSAYIRATKTGVSVRGRRRDSDGSRNGGDACGSVHDGAGSSEHRPTTAVTAQEGKTG